MLRVRVTVLACATAIATQGISEERFKEIVQQVNNDPHSTWQADMPSDRAKDFKSGLLPFETSLGYKKFPPMQVPLSYDARTKYPQCTTISSVRDQCGCGSCFAFGALGAFEDRICIHLGKNVSMSVEDIISCHEDENMSCDGGNPIAVWQNILGGKQADDGAVQESCYPYQISPCPCNHHNAQSGLPQCPGEADNKTPMCDLMKKFSCQDKGIFKANDPLLIPAMDMEQELVTNGPITVAYTVFDDFLTYKSGIYKKSVAAQPLGGHSVKIVGYGSEGATKYWIVANSWNSEFGENGFFRIVRGTDECGIESQAVVAGIPAALI